VIGGALVLHLAQGSSNELQIGAVDRGGRDALAVWADDW